MLAIAKTITTLRIRLPNGSTYTDSSGLNVPPVSLSNVPGVSETNVPPISGTNVPGISL